MDQFNQANNNNDLQRAIDEISNGSEETPAPATNEDVNIQVNLGEPPVPPMDDFGMPPLDGAAVNPPEPPVEAPTPAPAGDLASVRETALKELVPIIDKASLSPDRQFGIIATVIESTRDKSFIGKALEAARGITDEKTRAEALLKLVSLIDQ